MIESVKIMSITEERSSPQPVFIVLYKLLHLRVLAESGLCPILGQAMELLSQTWVYDSVSWLSDFLHRSFVLLRIIYIVRQVPEPSLCQHARSTPCGPIATYRSISLYSGRLGDDALRIHCIRLAKSMWLWSYIRPLQACIMEYIYIYIYILYNYALFLYIYIFIDLCMHVYV